MGSPGRLGVLCLVLCKSVEDTGFMATKGSQDILVCVEMGFRAPSLQISVLRVRMLTWHSRRSLGCKLAVLFIRLGSSTVRGLWVAHSSRAGCGLVAGVSH